MPTPATASMASSRSAGGGRGPGASTTRGATPHPVSGNLRGRPKEHAAAERDPAYQQAKATWGAAQQAHRSNMAGITDPAARRTAQEQFQGTRQSWRQYQADRGRTRHPNATGNRSAAGAAGGAAVAGGAGGGGTMHALPYFGPTGGSGSAGGAGGGRGTSTNQAARPVTTAYPSPPSGNAEMDGYNRSYDNEYNRYFAREEDFEKQSQGRYTSTGQRIAGSIWG